MICIKLAVCCGFGRKSFQQILGPRSDPDAFHCSKGAILERAIRNGSAFMFKLSASTGIEAAPTIRLIEHTRAAKSNMIVMRSDSPTGTMELDRMLLQTCNLDPKRAYWRALTVY